MSESGPYGTAADVYWAAGWHGLLPLPARAKKNPPRGFTGEGGIYPSYPDIFAWREGPERLGNIALRMPANVIGLDVDAYGDKPGRETLALAEAAHGELPPTWRTTSRDDGVSGIRLYRVPEGLAWPGELGPATEIIQARHRYAIVWPSIHPEGKTYRWITPDGVISTQVPDPDDLPLLPEPWVLAYTGGLLATTTQRASVATGEAMGWVAGQDHATSDMCMRMERALDQFAHDLRGSAHNSTRDAVLRAARLADEGHHGVVHAIASIRKDFIADATSPNRTLLGKNRRTAAEASFEFGELVTSAVGLVIANPSGFTSCDCFGQITGQIIPAETPAIDGTTALAPLEAPQAALLVDETEPDAEEGASRRFKDGAAFILDAPETLPNIWGEADDSLWAEGEALMICGPPGVGKTTLTGQVVRGLLGLQDSVLGLPVRKASKRVLYLAMDRPAQIARGLRRAFHESERATLKEHLRFWEGPPPGDVARHPTVLLSLAELAEADVIIIDSVKDAAVGLSEDEVAAAYNRARQNCLANGVQVLELHHMVKRGANGNKPKELADVYGSAWLTAGAGSVMLLWGAAGDPIVEMLHLKQPAGEVGPWRLEHDHNKGVTHVSKGADLLTIVAGGGYVGVNATDAARLLYDSDKPTDVERRKALRKLDRLAENGLVERYEKDRDPFSGGRPQAYFRVVGSNGQATVKSDVSAGQSNGHGFGVKSNSQTGQPTVKDDVSAGQSNGQSNGHNGQGGNGHALPPLQGGGAQQDDRAAAEARAVPVLQVSCSRCYRPTPEFIAQTWDGLCANCAHEAGLV